MRLNISGLWHERDAISSGTTCATMETGTGETESSDASYVLICCLCTSISAYSVVFWPVVDALEPPVIQTCCIPYDDRTTYENRKTGSSIVDRSCLICADEEPRPVSLDTLMAVRHYSIGCRDHFIDVHPEDNILGGKGGSSLIESDA